MDAMLDRNAKLACAQLAEHFKLTTQIILGGYDAAVNRKKKDKRSPPARQLRAGSA